MHVLKEFNEEVLRIYTDLIDKAKKDKEFNNNIDLKEVVIFCIILLKGSIGTWLSLPSSSSKTISDKNIKIFSK